VSDGRDRCKNKSNTKHAGKRGENETRVHYALHLTAFKLDYGNSPLWSQSTIFWSRVIDSTGAGKWNGRFGEGTMRIAALAVMALFSAPAHAALYQVDLSTMTPTGALYGPCYCGFGPLYPVMHFNPGDTVDFGSIHFHQFSIFIASVGTRSRWTPIENCRIGISQGRLLVSIQQKRYFRFRTP
jgi:hypothetical protein